jgi:hypothetical protein
MTDEERDRFEERERLMIDAARHRNGRMLKLEAVRKAAAEVSRHFDHAARDGNLPPVIRSLAPEFIALADALEAADS